MNLNLFSFSLRFRSLSFAAAYSRAFSLDSRFSLEKCVYEELRWCVHSFCALCDIEFVLICNMAKRQFAKPACTSQLLLSALFRLPISLPHSCVNDNSSFRGNFAWSNKELGKTDKKIAWRDVNMNEQNAINSVHLVQVHLSFWAALWRVIARWFCTGESVLLVSSCLLLGENSDVRIVL